MTSRPNGRPVSGNKLTQEYEVYSQKFQKEDFGDDEPFDPKVLPNEYLTSPNSTHTFVYVSTIQHIALGHGVDLIDPHGDLAEECCPPDTSQRRKVIENLEPNGLLP